MVVHIALFSSEDATEARDCLISERANARNMKRRMKDNTEASFMATSMFMQNELIASNFDTFEFRTEVRQEKLQQFNDCIGRKEAVIVLEGVLRNHVFARCERAFKTWTKFVREENSNPMQQDRER